MHFVTECQLQSLQTAWHIVFNSYHQKWSTKRATRMKEPPCDLLQGFFPLLQKQKGEGTPLKLMTNVEMSKNVIDRPTYTTFAINMSVTKKFH